MHQPGGTQDLFRAVGVDDDRTGEGVFFAAAETGFRELSRGEGKLGGVCLTGCRDSVTVLARLGAGNDT